MEGGHGLENKKTLITKTASSWCLLPRRVHKLSILEHLHNCSQYDWGKESILANRYRVPLNVFFLAPVEVTEFKTTDAYFNLGLTLEK